MALVDDDEVEEVRWILAEVRRWLSVRVGAEHEGLKDRKEDAGIGRDFSGLTNRVRRDADTGIVGKLRQGVVGLIGKDVAVGEEQNARAARRLT